MSVSNVIKICLCGNQSGGKSRLLMRFVQGNAYNHITEKESTIGAAFFKKIVATPSRPDVPQRQLNQQWKLDCWDLPGNKRFDALIPMYFEGTNVFLILFDVTNRESFEEGVPHHIALFEKHARPMDSGSTVVFLVATKCDAAPSERVVPTAEALQLAQSKSYFYKETSAKTGQGVAELFDEIAWYAAKYGFAADDGTDTETVQKVKKQKKKSRGSFFPSLNQILGKKDKNKDNNCDYETL